MKIAVLSRNPKLYSTKRLVEAGIARGHEMVVIDHAKCDLVIEKKKPQIYYNGELIDDIEAFAETLPMKRLGKPEEIGNFVKSIIEHDIKYLSGAVINFDGANSNFVF